MLDTPKITQKTANQLTAVIRLTVPQAEIRNVIGPCISELIAAIAVQNTATTGPRFSHHLRMDPDIFDFEIGAPVTAPISVSGRARSSQLPAVTVVRMVYHETCEDPGAARGEFNT